MNAKNAHKAITATVKRYTVGFTNADLWKANASKWGLEASR